MLEETGSGSFVGAEGWEKRDEAKVGQFFRLLEAVHRLVDTKDDVGLAGRVCFKEGKEIEAEENGRGELMSENFDVLGKGEVGAKIKVGEIDGAKERVVGDDRVEEDVDGRERGDLGGGGAEEGRRSPPAVLQTRRSTGYLVTVLPGQYRSTISSTFLLLFVITGWNSMFLYKGEVG
jgi:hypothetical protein